MIIKDILWWVETKEDSPKPKKKPIKRPKPLIVIDVNSVNDSILKELEINETVIVPLMLKCAQGSHASKLRGCAIKQ